MKSSNRILERFFRSSGIPLEALPGVPIIEIFGDKRVIIEKHYGVKAYEPNEIFVNVSLGCICVAGNDLSIAWMSKERLVIIGSVSCVSLQSGRT